ncbi:MAG: oxygen-independent coproporphyrinogen III oxidase [Leptospirales bacterium]
MSDNNTMQQTEDVAVRQLIDRYNTPVPRYTSYPTALEFEPEFNESLFFEALNQMDQEKPISLYIHIPFCEKRCHYCGCNVIVSRRKELLAPFLDDLYKEIQHKIEKIGFKPQVAQLHFGGGTPNYLSAKDWEELLAFLKEHFTFNSEIEMSVELDPMHLNDEYLTDLKKLGFNRLSFGIQDIHDKVQHAVNREQSFDHINACYSSARKLGFDSLNVDFIYGLPYQDEESFNENIDWVKTHRPDRIAIFSYAHIPWIKSHQKNMPEEALPDAATKMSIYLSSRKKLLEIGYVAIGIDHYAIPEDELSRAREDRSLHRNFMGYTTKANIDMLAFGPSAISMVGGVFVQNHLKLRSYESAARTQESHFEKGYKMTEEDILRSEVIQSIMNNLFVDIQEINKKWNIDFWSKFGDEKERLNSFKSEGLIKYNDSTIEVTKTGSYVVRHIATTFDAYRGKNDKEKRFSKGI